MHTCRRHLLQISIRSRATRVVSESGATKPTPNFGAIFRMDQETEKFGPFVTNVNTFVKRMIFNIVLGEIG